MSQAGALVTFRAAIIAALPSLSSRVIYAQPVVAGAPRPALPYLTMDVTSDEVDGECPYERTTPKVGTGDPVEQTHYLRRKATVRLTWYGDGGQAGLAMLRLAKLRPTVFATLRAGATGGVPVSVHTLSDILDTTELRTTNWEAAAAQDWAMRYLTSDTFDVGSIETITVPVNEPEE